jgi:uncharacterized protein YuzE
MEALRMIENKKNMNWDYDSESDVLYLTFGEPQPAEGIDINDGTIVRVNSQTGEICGITIINPLKRTLNSFKKRSLNRHKRSRSHGNY